MAQIIKHRRGSIGSVKTTTARNAELIVASGSISDLSGPFVFIGSPSTSDEGVAGAYKAVSKIYQGTNAPTIAAGTYGSTLDGTPFYSTNDQTLYILNRDNVGHTNMDLTGNLEGRSIDKITLSSLNGSINVTGSVVVSQNISASGNISASNLQLEGNADIKGNINLGGNINIGNQNSDLIVFGGEVSSSILPELNNEFNLGAPTQNWKNLHVSGTAYINQAKISNMEINGVIVFEDLIVSGNTFLGDSTSDKVNVTGSLNISGSQTLTGSLSQLGDYNLVGSQRIQNNLTVSGSTFLGDNVTDFVNVTASFNVSGSQTITGSFKLRDASSNFSIVGNGFGQTSLISPDGAIVMTPGLYGVQINGANPDLTVDGDVSIKGGTIDVTNAATNISLKDNTSNALTINQGSDNYLAITTTDGSELITLGNTITSITSEVEANAANAFKVVQSANTYINVATTNSSEKVTIGNDLASIDNVIEDNAANAFKVVESTNTYINVATTDSAEKVTIGNNLASIDNVIEDNVANAFVVKEGSNPYITIDTTGGSEKITLNTAGNVEITGITTISNSTQNTIHTDGALVVTGGVGIGKNLYVSGSTTIAGNLTVLGSSSVVNISSSTVNIDDNIIRLNAFAPFLRYAGIEMMDSGSNNVSASLLWDSTNDYFLIASASGETGRVISTTYGTQGSEIALTPNILPKATGASAIGDSYLKDDGTSFSYYTDALVVTGSSGQTYIKGKVTLVHSGGTDANSNTSAIIPVLRTIY